MTTSSLAFEARLAVPFAEALERVAEALKAQGFGVLTRIDVRATLKDKLGVDFRDYVILGACNPRLAHRALSARSEVGLLLPCNVTVEQTTDGVRVSFADPGVMLSMSGFESDPAVVGVASEARALIAAAAESLKGRAH